MKRIYGLIFAFLFMALPVFSAVETQWTTENGLARVEKIGKALLSKNNLPTQVKFTVVETDEVNAELLSSRLNFEGEKDYLNKSVNANDQFIDVAGYGTYIDSNMISYMTIEAVGAAVADFDEYPLEINFLPPDRIKQDMVEVGGYEVEMKKLLIVTIGFALVLALIVGMGGKTILQMQNDASSQSAGDKARQVEVFKKRVKEAEGSNGKNIFPVLKQLIDTNTNVLNVYNALSTDIPDTMYIRKFVTNSAGGIGIIGEAKTSEEITAFAKELKEKKSDLSLTKISINTESDPIPAKIKDGFTFEIKTENTDIYLNEGSPLSMESIQTQINNAQGAQPARARRGARGNSRGTMAPPPPII